mmetsp:Transcript_80905/g.262275  ORF Transcript_80905/g.262275 Transcript_80905/m.262275 type:complete len:99 (-) Transcript_80905:71-367(-)
MRKVCNANLLGDITATLCSFDPGLAVKDFSTNGISSMPTFTSITQESSEFRDYHVFYFEDGQKGAVYAWLTADEFERFNSSAGERDLKGLDDIETHSL